MFCKVSPLRGWGEISEKLLLIAFRKNLSRESVQGRGGGAPAYIFGILDFELAGWQLGRQADPGYQPLGGFFFSGVTLDWGAPSLYRYIFQDLHLSIFSRNPLMKTQTPPPPQKNPTPKKRFQPLRLRVVLTLKGV